MIGQRLAWHGSLELYCIMLAIFVLLPLSTRAEPDIGWADPEIVENVLARYNDDYRIVFDGSGNGIAIWAQNITDHYDIVSNRYIPGHGWGDVESVENDERGDARSPSLAVFPNGSVISTWSQYDGYHYNLWTNIYRPGSGWGISKRIPRSEGDSKFSYVAVDASGIASIVWCQEVQFKGKIMSVRTNEFGNWGEAETISNSYDGSAGWPRVTIDDSGKALAIWRQEYDDGNSVSSNIFIPGQGWGNSQDVTPKSADNHPYYSTDDIGNAYALWNQENGSTLDLMAKRYDPAQGWIDLGRITSTGWNDRAYYCTASVDYLGNAVAVWAQKENETIRIRSSVYARSFGWSEPEEIDVDNGGRAIELALSMDPSGNAIAAWSQQDAERDKADLWCNVFSKETGWGTAMTIEKDVQGDAREPMVAIDDHGNALVLWSLGKGISYDLWSTRYFIVDVTPPPLFVTSPTESIITKTSTILISGITEQWAVVDINGISPTVQTDGSFSCMIALSNGSNSISITSRDLAGNVANVQRIVIFEDPIPGMVDDLRRALDQMNITKDKLNTTNSQLNSTEAENEGLKEDLNRMKLWNPILVLALAILVILAVVIVLILAVRKKSSDKEMGE